MTPPPSPVKTNATVTLMATVSQGSNAVSRATVWLTLVSPSGTTAEKVVTDSAGRATWTYKVSPKAVAGSYSVSAQLTHENETATSDTVPFTVQ